MCVCVCVCVCALETNIMALDCLSHDIRDFIFMYVEQILYI